MAQLNRQLNKVMLSYLDCLSPYTPIKIEDEEVQVRLIESVCVISEPAKHRMDKVLQAHNIHDYINRKYVVALTDQTPDCPLDYLLAVASDQKDYNDERA